jgi:hypothetical protein
MGDAAKMRASKVGHALSSGITKGVPRSPFLEDFNLVNGNFVYRPGSVANWHGGFKYVPYFVS